jgi:hypothetical protein
MKTTQAQMERKLLPLIKSNQIRIVSGEGETGTMQIYNGARTLRAVKARLTKERCGGQRWAKAMVFSHSNDGGDIYVDIESGQYC